MRKEHKSSTAVITDPTEAVAPDSGLAEVSTRIDQVFEQLYFEMNEEEARAHVMRLVYHMLGMASEIRIISSTQIKKDCESEELRIERQKVVEKFLSEKVAAGLDRLLSDESLQLDLDTSRELFYLTGGGVRLNGKYAPVQAIKINEVLKTVPVSEF